jgi:hypothetical protein
MEWMNRWGQTVTLAGVAWQALIVIGLIVLCYAVQKTLARWVFVPTGWPLDEADAFAFVLTVAALLLGIAVVIR